MQRVQLYAWCAVSSNTWGGQADPNGKPVTMVFCTRNAASYLSMLDIIMVDPYPIPGSPASTVAAALANVASLGKPVMMVPQAFGGGENWARGNSLL